jgi:hypothetical protein
MKKLILGLASLAAVAVVGVSSVLPASAAGLPPTAGDRADAHAFSSSLTCANGAMQTGNAPGAGAMERRYAASLLDGTCSDYIRGIGPASQLYAAVQNQIAQNHELALSYLGGATWIETGDEAAHQQSLDHNANAIALMQQQDALMPSWLQG